MRPPPPAWSAPATTRWSPPPPAPASAACYRQSTPRTTAHTPRRQGRVDDQPLRQSGEGALHGFKCAVYVGIGVDNRDVELLVRVDQDTPLEQLDSPAQAEARV